MVAVCTKAFGYKIKYLSKINAKCKVSQDQSVALLTVFKELILLLLIFDVSLYHRLIVLKFKRFIIPDSREVESLSKLCL